MKVAIYLRKSRADEEIEKTLGEGETLARHRKILLEVAEKKGLNILRIFEEVVSGESIIYRPAMLELLQEVEQKRYEGVLVIDQQRLGRGDMEEQGVILKTFKESDTKIITPEKTYDLNNEFDEEYSEFEAFMSRKEYKMITKRLRRGVLRSVQEGNYMSPKPPYGYLIKEDKNHRTLMPNPDQAPVIKKIFDWYVKENIGSKIISERLNSLGYKTILGNPWSAEAISFVLKNPIYIGKISWKKTVNRKTKEKVIKKVNKKSEWIISDGQHEPIVDINIFNKAQEIMKEKYKPPVKPSLGLANPLAGIVTCKICGSKLRYRPYSNVEPHLICINKCGNKSSKFKYVENAIIEELTELSQKINPEIRLQKPSNNNFLALYQEKLESLQKELKNITIQKNKLFDLLEQGVYDIDTFTERSKVLSDRSEETNNAIKYAEQIIEKELSKDTSCNNYYDKIKNIIDAYHDINDNEKKNLLLKEVIEKVEYYKPKGNRDDNFHVYLYPKM